MSTPRCYWCSKPADIYDSGDRNIPSQPNGLTWRIEGYHPPLPSSSPGLVAFCPGCAAIFDEECPRGDSNPHRLSTPAPEAGVSTDSTTRAGGN